LIHRVKTRDMSTILWVIGLVLMGILTLTVFGMTITKKDYEDYEELSRFVDKMIAGPHPGIMNDCLEEWQRLFDGGHVPVDDMVELRIKIIKKFR